MKRQLLVLLTTILSFNCYSQITFEEGYYIDNTNQKINCLIKNIDWANNPTEFQYKLSANSEPITQTLSSVKEFGINNVSKYVKRSVKIDRSSDKINHISIYKNPEFKDEELFLKVLVEGKTTLYQYIDGNLTRYFYEKNDSNIEQLIFKLYKKNVNKIYENNRYKQQLWMEFKCPKFTMSKIERLNYAKKDLVNFFVEYNNCNDQEYVNFEAKQKRDLFNLTIRPRLNSSSLTIENSVSSSRNTDFDNEMGVSLGIEAEYIFPFNKNKWSFIIEPSYQNYKSEKTTETENISGGVTIANIDYQSIEVPIGVRHYFFLNNNSKIFVNASYVFDFYSKSPIEFTRKDGSSLYSLNIETRNNTAYGVGYNYKKYSIELRYQSPRKILDDFNYYNWSSKYKSISIILGYSIF